MHVEITGNDHGPAAGEPFEVTIKAKPGGVGALRRDGFKWQSFKTAKERNAYAEGAVVGASIECDQHAEAWRDRARMDDLERLFHEGEDVLDALADMIHERVPAVAETAS